MRIIIEGSSQKKHISNLFEEMGHTCMELSHESNKIKRRIINFVRLLCTDAVYQVGGLDIQTNYFFRLARIFRKRIIIHWIGTDVLNIVNSYRNSPRKININCINLAGSNLLSQELNEINIKAPVVPIFPFDTHFSPLPAPHKHAVMVYIPKGREEFYGMDLVKEVAKCFPDIPFHVVANDGENELNKLNNIIYEGSLDAGGMNELYKKCSILFRYPKHDGLSMMVLEAMGIGRTVIYKYPFPNAITPNDDSIESIINVFDAVLSLPPHNNQKAIEFINTNFSSSKQEERYRKAGVL